MAENTKMVCRGCGASLNYSAKERSLKCSFCGTVTDIARPSFEELPPTAGATRVIMPLAVELADLTDAVYAHLATGDLTPDHLLEHATFIKTERMYAPVYIYTGDFTARWTASFGYDRQEQYTDYETRYENGKNRKVPVSKTKTVTDWRPVNGTDSGGFATFGYAGKQLLSATCDAVALVENKPPGDLVPFDDSYIRQIPIEDFSNSPDNVYTSRAISRVNAIIDDSVRQHAQGDRQKDWHWTADVNKEHVSVLMPICHAVYEFEGKSYNVWTSGVDARYLVADKLPEDANRKSRIFWGYTPFALTLPAAAVAVQLFNVEWFWPAAALGLSAIYAYIRKSGIINHSKGLRANLLAKRRADSGGATLTTAPSRSLFGNPTLDKVSLLIATTLFVGLCFVGGHKDGSENASSSTAATTPVTDSAQTAGTTSQPTSIPVAPSAENLPASAESAVPSTNSSGNTQQGDAQIQQVSAVLRAVIAGDWALADSLVNSIRSQTTPIPQGDRVTARAANAEGLSAFGRGDFPTAVAAFDRAVSADRSDIEARNNLGFALLKANRNDDAGKVLIPLLMQVPDRSSAWANLSESLTGVDDLKPATAALKLAVRFSASRDRTVVAFNRVIAGYPNERYRNVVQFVMADMENIPRGPNDRSAVANFQAPPVPNYQPRQQSTQSAQTQPAARPLQQTDQTIPFGRSIQPQPNTPTPTIP